MEVEAKEWEHGGRRGSFYTCAPSGAAFSKAPSGEKAHVTILREASSRLRCSTPFGLRLLYSRPEQGPFPFGRDLNPIRPLKLNPSVPVEL